jgi:hypothetical protein
VEGGGHLRPLGGGCSQLGGTLADPVSEEEESRDGDLAEVAFETDLVLEAPSRGRQRRSYRIRWGRVQDSRMESLAD